MAVCSFPRTFLPFPPLTSLKSANGEAELYAYLPLLPSNTRALLSVPDSHENSDYGFSVGRGAWRFESGKWFAVATRMKLNEVGREDGTFFPRKRLWIMMNKA